MGRHVPGSTRGNDNLKRVVIRNISQIEKGLSLVGDNEKDPKTGVPVGEGLLPYGMFTIADTTVVTPPGEQSNGQWIEQWKINRGSTIATYTIAFTPDSKGGTEIRVSLPPSVERKH